MGGKGSRGGGGRGAGQGKRRTGELEHTTADLRAALEPTWAARYLRSRMTSKPVRKPALEIVEPVGKRVLIRKDEDKKQTKTGIHLPDKIEIPTLAGRVVAISVQVERDEDYSIKQYDRVLFNPKHAIPVEFEGDNRLFVIPIEDVVAIFRKAEEAE
jgi:chaperonin GroES